MAMEQRITTLSFHEAYARYQEAMVEVAEILDSHDEILMALEAYVPLIRAGKVRLDSRIDSVEDG